MTFITKCTPVLIALFFSAATYSQQPKGYIQNDTGKKCWYSQTITVNNTYFHSDGITSNTAAMVFDDPSCMSSRNANLGLNLNKMMINNIITRPYAHQDAKFQTRVEEMYPTSLLQVKGSCIQSKTYPQIGVTVDYILNNHSIVKVIHGLAAGSCKK